MIGGWIVRAVVTAVAVLLALPAAASAARHLYVTSAGASDEVSIFQVAANGAITELPPADSPEPAGSDPQGVTLSPDGAGLYVASAGDDTVRGFEVAPNGALTAMPSVPAGTDPTGITATVDGRFVYVTNYGGTDVSGYSVGPDGTLTPLASSPFPAAGAPRGVASSPDAESLYVAAEGSSEIFAYDIGADGTLTEKAGSPYPTPNPPQALAITPNGNNLYAAGGGNSVNAFNVDANGELTPVLGSPFPAPVTSPYDGIAVTPNGANLLLTGQSSDNAVSLAIGAGGILGPAGLPVPAGDEPAGIAVTPSGVSAYAAGAESDELFRYSFATGGALAPAGEPLDLPVGDANFQSAAITPNQPPVAAFSLGATPSDVVATFNANASVDPDGPGINSYRWDFGDGETQTTAIPTTAHQYAENGTYDVTLRVTDVEGCSTARVYTGQNTLCNGSPVAQITKTIDTTAPPTPDNRVSNPQLVLKPTQRQGKQIRVVAKVGAGEAARIKIRGFIKQSKQKVKLKKRTVQVKGTNRKQVNLKVRSAHANKKVRKLIRKAGAIRATVVADYRDDAGNTAKLRKHTTLMFKQRKRR